MKIFQQEIAKILNSDGDAHNVMLHTMSAWIDYYLRGGKHLNYIDAQIWGLMNLLELMRFNANEFKKEMAVAGIRNIAARAQELHKRGEK